jgi:hypothetical protein
MYFGKPTDPLLGFLIVYYGHVEPGPVHVPLVDARLDLKNETIPSDRYHMVLAVDSAKLSACIAAERPVRSLKPDHEPTFTRCGRVGLSRVP